MPRPTQTVDDVTEDQVPETQVISTPADDSNRPAAEPTAESNGKRPRRPRRTIVPPPGITLGVMEDIEPGTPPPRTRRGAGRNVDPKTIKAIEKLRANPGQTFKIGVFGSAASPDGAWKEAGVVFKNVSLGDGLFERWAHIPAE